MFRPCPHCGFLVALIAGREASQRCPRCGSALVAEHEVLDTPADAAQRPQRGEAPLAPVPETMQPPHRRNADEPGGGTDEPRSAATIDIAAAPEDSQAADANAVSDDVVRAARHAGASGTPQESPSFVRHQTRTGPRGRRWPLAIVIAGLTLLLALQLLLSQRVELARAARWRPLVVNACGVLGCDVPAWHEPAAWRMLARGVRPDPDRPGVLRVTATVRNDAVWPQAPPVVVLSLSDVDGRLVASRSVTPREYGAARKQSVAPGQSLDVGFDVREPAGRVESFDFRLQ